MKIVFRTFIFHMCCIFIFALLYSNFENEFYSLYNNNNKNKKDKTFLDFFLFSTTIQAGVGISELLPLTSLTKMLMIIQQIIMIMTHLFTIYIFTL